MNDLPQRKPQRLQQYDYSKSGAYFITLCTYHRAPLFDIRSANNPRHILVKRLTDLENNYGVRIDKYVIMPDHLHFILWNPDSINRQTSSRKGVPLHKFIQWFKTTTTTDYIRGVKSGYFPAFDKHIWQRGYYDHIIRNDQDYQDIWRYIDNNPIKADMELLNK